MNVGHHKKKNRKLLFGRNFHNRFNYLDKLTYIPCILYILFGQNVSENII